VAKKGETGGRKKLPQTVLDEIAKTVNALFQETGFTVRQAEKEWGIDVATLSHARKADGSVGVGFLIKLRAVTRRTIDDLLGLPPLPRSAVTPVAALHATALQEAIVEAKRFGTPDTVINHVQRNFAMSHSDPAHRKEAWIRAFLRTWAVWAASHVPELSKSAREWLDLHPEPTSEHLDAQPWEETG
jgi:hypothetical protein